MGRRAPIGAIGMRGRGDQELVEFFDAVLENNPEAAQRAKEMLAARFQGERE